jgi:hypothetical protein
VLNIDSPTDGSTFNETEFVTFTGTANDVEDGDVSTFIQWSSDIDGASGTGAGITTTLSVDLHAITESVW